MRLLSAVHPTTNQKRVLAKILAAPTPTVAGEEISKDANLVAARNMLMKLGIITFANNEAALTDRGTQVAAEENIADQSGQLTPTGQQLAYTNAQGQTDSDQAGGAAQQQPAPDMGLDAGMPTESLALLKQLLG
jgi:predicted methyltransferase